jgi:hypothetical protein
VMVVLIPPRYPLVVGNLASCKPTENQKKLKREAQIECGFLQVPRWEQIALLNF